MLQCLYVCAYSFQGFELFVVKMAAADRTELMRPLKVMSMHKLSSYWTDREVHIYMYTL